tara:strand:- start:513 stop:716 length:204 start_codon:yes stop_codon:yes gene_type:complete
MSKKKQKYCKENYVRYSLLGIKKGNLYDYLEDDVLAWLTQEAVKTKSESLAILIAAILKDTYHEENN